MGRPVEGVRLFDGEGKGVRHFSGNGSGFVAAAVLTETWSFRLSGVRIGNLCTDG